MTRYHHNPLRQANNLSYGRSITSGPAKFTAFDSKDPDRKLTAVLVQPHRGRGAFLNHPLSKDFDPSKSNIVEGDTAYLPSGTDSYHLKFTLNVTSKSRMCHTCELALLASDLYDLAKSYAEIGGYHYLAQRYVWRIMSGAFLYRNFTIATNQCITVTFINPAIQTVIRHQGRGLGQHVFPGLDALRNAVPDVDILIDAFAKALAEEDAEPLIIEVIGTGMIGDSMEVYPSQVFSETKDDYNPKRLVSKPIGNGQFQVEMNPGKITNSIRGIDEWYGSNATGNPDAPAANRRMAAIAVEAYGFVQSRLQAMRPKHGDNFYNLLWDTSQHWPALIEQASTAASLPGNLHYFMAMLIRGGVFAAPSKKATAAASKPAAAGVPNTNIAEFEPSDFGE